jgi:ATP-dependent DNA ligase
LTTRRCASCRSKSVSDCWPGCLRGRHPGIALNTHHIGDGDIVYRQACKLGCEGIVSKRLGSTYRSGRSRQWVKVKNPAAPAVRREAEEDWR